MGEGEEWSIRELGDLLLRIGSIILLLIVIAGVIFISTRKTTKETYRVDFDNIVSELEDIRPGETIKVPLLSSGHTLIIRPISQVAQLGLNCKIDEGTFCACLKSGDSVELCKSFNIQAKEGSKITIISDSEIALNNKLINLTYGEGNIRIY